MTAGVPTDKRVLVTGGAGFIGSHIVDALVDDNEVTVIDDLSAGDVENVNDAAEFVQADVRDPDVYDGIENVDVVFHEAGMISVDRSVEDPMESHNVNSTGTLALLEFARRQDARVVLASSSSIYGEPETLPVSEEAVKRPANPYAVDKLTLDQYAQVYHDLYGLPTVPLRYFNVYGPRQRATDYGGVISIFVRQATNGDPITVDGDGTQTRDFVHVRDVVQANLLAASTDAVGRGYNVGTGSRTSIRELAETIRDVSGGSSSIVHSEPRPGDVDHSCASIERAIEGLGYEPTVTLDDGLETII